MEHKINVLPDALINKIAAGEVVQRPASVAKELIENAIDAGSDRIEIIVKDGGKALIQVIDNGVGLSRADFDYAFRRYATSKISSFDDLINVSTLGFRGEALASIASVAMVEMVSKQAGADHAYRIAVKGGTAESPSPHPGINGTSISVANLFYNTPARRKFLKGRIVEFRHILGAVKRFALMRPDISFVLNHDDKGVLDLHAGTLRDRIGALFGQEYTRNILPVEISYRNYDLDGFIGNLDIVRNKPGEQYWFVNGRYVSERMLNNAVFAAYRSLIDRGEYPFFSLSLKLPPGEIDVNVHPAKMEVKFKDEWQVYTFIKESVFESLKNIGASIPGFFKSGQSQADRPVQHSSFQVGMHLKRPGDPAHHPDSIRAPERLLTEDALNIQFGKDWIERASKYTQRESDPDAGDPLVPHDAEIWQIHNKYLISPIKSGIVIVDQHVAHERILYEQALKSMNDTPRSGQQLLFPQVVEFSADDFSNLLDIVPYLKKIGFHFSEFGKHAILIEAVPPEMKWGKEGKAIREILDHFTEYKNEETSIQKRVAASYACKAAIKSGDSLSPVERRTLIDKLFTTENPYYCPHGRPVIVSLSLDELDKRFER